MRCDRHQPIAFNKCKLHYKLCKIVYIITCTDGNWSKFGYLRYLNIFVFIYIQFDIANEIASMVIHNKILQLGYSSSSQYLNSAFKVSKT